MPTKHERIVALLDNYKLDALLIQQAANFSWATDGAASYINTAATKGTASLLISRSERHLITNNIEAPRLEQEEQLVAAGWQFHVDPWHLPPESLPRLTKGLKIGADLPYPGAQDVSATLSLIRSYLDVEEQARFRTLGGICAEAMDEAIRGLQPGMSEHEIAARLAGATLRRGALPTVALIATDERIFKYRHPLPTAKKLQKYAMLVLCGRQRGLVCSITRLIHFGPLNAELRQKEAATAFVDASLIAATRPGKTVAQVFSLAQAAYDQVGFGSEWQLHHQGGPAGFDPREFLANPAADAPIGLGQAYAWNPSISGVKSEDTILVGEAGNQILTEIPGWPRIPVEVAGQTLERPAILVVA